MRTEEHQFYSDGNRLSGRFYLPVSGQIASPQPLIVACSGFTGLCSMHPARFARYFTPRGYQCFCFDYRGFGRSEGLKGRVVLEEQVRDIISACAFVRGQSRVCADRIFLLGWGLGAGLLLDAAREQPGVAGIIALDGLYWGRRVQAAWRGEEGFDELVTELDRERLHRVETGEVRMADAFHYYPLNPRSQEYVDDVLREDPDYDTAGYSFELGDSLIRWHPEAHAPYMRVPLFIGHGDDNRLHPPEEAKSLHQIYAGPKTLYWVRGAGHTEWMFDGDPRFKALCTEIVNWLNAHLRDNSDQTALPLEALPHAVSAAQGDG